MTTTTHRVLIGDTLPALAARYLGDAQRWREIVVANNLRPPYISSEPLAQYGVFLARYALAVTASGGQRSIVLSGADPSLLRPGVQLVVQRYTTAGQRLLDAPLLESFSSDAATLARELAHSYPAGTEVLIYPPPGELQGVVARPGDALVIPSQDETPSTTIERDDRFGRDLACNERGHLSLTPTGDLAVAAGLANFYQQLRLRLRCEPGSLTRHSTYGCQAHAYIGQVNGPVLGLLVQSALALAIGADPRVSSVEAVSATVRGDVITAQVQVVARGEAIDLSLQL